jgi:PAS domain S-box-containing protein
MAINSDKLLSIEQFNRLFPFHFEIGSDLKFTHMGGSLIKLIGDCSGQLFQDHFIINRPYLKEVSWHLMKSSNNELYILEDKHKKILFRGQFEFLESNNTVIFIGSPWLQSIDQLEDYQMHINDFSVHDPTFDLLHILKNVEINSDEIKALLKKLKEKSDLIKKSEAQYKATLNMASEVIYRSNEQGFFTYVNPASEKITGFSSAELLTKKFTDLIREDFKRVTLAKYVRQVKQNIESTYHEFPFITKEGDEKWLGQSVQLIKHDQGYEFVVLAIDITKQKQNEFALIETNKRLKLFQTLIDNTTDAIQVAKEDGQLVYLNIEASKRLGISMDKMTNFFIPDFDLAYPDLKSWYRHLIKLKTKGPSIIEGTNVNQITGVKFPVEETVGFFEINENGYVISNSRDITRRKLIEESLRKQREKYQSIIANMNLGLLEVDKDDKIQFVNPCFELMSGYKMDELIGHSASSLFMDDDNRALVSNKYKEREIGHSDMYEMPIRTKAGYKRWWMISGAPNYNDHGELIGSIGIHLDVTESKELELNLEIAREKAEESSKAKESFLANMSHEIRTPLNAIIGMIRELGKERLSEKQSYFVGNVSIASQHLLSVLNNVLDISKIEAGELQLDAHDFDLKSILNEVRSIMITRCLEKNLYFKINQDAPSKTIFIGDASRLRQVLINLVGNAVKFTESGGVTIDYEVSDLDDHKKSLKIIVKDTGIGMDKSYLSRLYDKFSQEDVSVSRNYGGSGLGMAITKELIQLMKGQITVSSEKNVGTSIILEFELAEGNIENTNVNDITFNLKGNVKILLVEDNEFNRVVALATLKNFNCEVTEAFNGLEAINILKSGEKFDVVLMDLQMPVMDGFESTYIIRNELKIMTPIIALTANAFKSELERCRQIGMNDSVTKPFEETKLMEAIYKAINRNQSNIAREKKEKEQKQESLFNLDNLEKLFRNDKQQIKLMIDIFINQIDSACPEINAAYLSGNLSLVYQLVHKIKPSIDSMGIASLKEVTRFIEKSAKENNNTALLEENIKVLTNTLNTVLLQLKDKPLH